MCKLLILTKNNICHLFVSTVELNEARCPTENAFFQKEILSCSPKCEAKGM